jgi:subtilisin family serine protease
MIAAGGRSAGPLATITGVAPGAQLGNYKVFGSPGFNDYATDEAILKAMDDAVSDGMDIINLSLGDNLAPRLGDDLEVEAVAASKAGVIVVAAVSNNGPDRTLFRPLPRRLPRSRWGQ